MGRGRGLRGGVEVREAERGMDQDRKLGERGWLGRYDGCKRPRLVNRQRYASVPTGYLSSSEPPDTFTSVNQVAYVFGAHSTIGKTEGRMDQKLEIVASYGSYKGLCQDKSQYYATPPKGIFRAANLVMPLQALTTSYPHHLVHNWVIVMMRPQVALIYLGMEIPHEVCLSGSR